MKIEAFFKPQAKAATAGQPGSNPSKQQLAEQLEKQRQVEAEHESKDIMPNLDRDVDKAGGSGGPLSECTNKRPGSGQATDAPAAKKQQLLQDVQAIDLCDSDGDDAPAPAAAVVAAGKRDPKRKPQQQGQQQQQDAPMEHPQQQDREQTPLKQHQQQESQQHEQKQNGCDDAEAMDVDLDMASPSAPGSKAASPAPSTAAEAAAAAVTGHKVPATPAAAPIAAAAEAEAGKQQPETPAAALKADAAAEAPSAIKSTAGKAAAEVLLTPEQRTQLVEQCQQELPLLEAELEVRPDLSGHMEADGKKPLDLKHRVSILVEGQALPLTGLSELISKTLSSSSSSSSGSPTNKGAATPAAGEPTGTADAAAATQDAAAAAAAAGDANQAAACDATQAAAMAGAASGPSALVVRNLIQEVASRKSYGLQDGALANVDALEDATLSFHWCWELRTFTGLPKAVKAHADAARKHRKQVLDRLRAASGFLQLAQSLTKPTKAAESKLAKAAAKLAKVSPLNALQAQLHAAVEAAVQQCSTLKAKQAVSRLDKADKEEQAAQAKAEKARQAEAEKAAREAERVAREAAKAAEAAEKARLKAEKEAQREAKRQAKADEAAKKAAEAEEKAAAAAKKKQRAEAAKAGFGSTTGLSKAQNVFKSFFGLPAERPLTPSNDQTSQGQGSQMEEGANNNNSSKEAGRVWAMPSGPSEQQAATSAALDQQLPYFASSRDSTAPAADLGQLLADATQHWKAVAGSQRKRVWGLPPSWARRPGVAQDLDHVECAAAALYGEGVDIHRLRCWRRKLIKHFDSVRPPFYGSVPRSRSTAVTGRRPFGKDLALDYEEMSDQDWEEEPEGESLSADEDGDEECGDEEGEDEEGFVVGDGYLSDDEGMRDEEEPLGCTGSQLAAAAAAAAAGGASGPGRGGCSTDSSATALAHLEAVLDHARSKGRHVLLVNNCPEMHWEPTTQLPPSILSCLRAQVMRTDITAAPPTPAELPHIFGASAAAAAAAAAAVAAAAGINSPAPAAAAAAAGVAADGSGLDAAAGGLAGGEAGVNAGAASGRGGRPATVFPEACLPALVQLVHNSKLSLDLLVKQFVESQAAAGVKVAKARVKDKIKEISSMRMVAKAPLYTVKPEVLQAMQQTGTATAAPAAGASAEPDAEADPMQVDRQPAAAEGQQQQQQEPAAGAAAEQSPELPVATAAAAAGHKRPPSDAAQATQQPDEDKQVGMKASASAAAAAAVAGSCPPAKKQRSTPAAGTERFFGAPSTVPKPQQQPAAATAGDQTQQQQQQQQQQHGTPPSTPKHKRLGVPSLHHSELQSAAAAGGSGDAAAAAAAAGGAGDGVERSGALPMLTPPSDAAAVEDRPGKGRHSPVPFRLNSLSTVQEAAATGAGDNAPAAPAAVTAAAGDAAGKEAAAAAATGPEQQQRQPARQNISHIFKRQQQLQQERGAPAGQPGRVSSSSGGGLLGGSSSHLSPAAAAAAGGGGASHTPSRLGAARAAAGGSSSSVSPPGLPEDGSAPSGAFWKQLAHWVVAVREPSDDDISAAFKVFDEHHLAAAPHTMPQNMLSAMVKTLGSHTQSLPMRAACARCISNTVRGLVSNEQTQQQQQQLDGGASPAPAQQQGGQVTPKASAAAGAGGGSASPSPLLRQDTPTAAAAGDRRPSPSASPRSAPMGASFEELCAEPKLLENLLLCLNPEKLLGEARAARAKAGSSGLGPGSEIEAEELARNAALAASTMLLVGVAGSPAARLPSLASCSAVTAAAAAELRRRVACVPNWRGALRLPIRTSDDKHRASYSLMAHYALLSDPTSCGKLVANKRLASGLLSVVATRGAKDSRWVIQKWCLLVLSTLLADATLRQWALPCGTALQPLQMGMDEACSSLETLVALLLKSFGRPQLSQPDSADRDVLSHCLQLSEVLLGYLAEQQQQSGLPPRLAELCVAEGLEGAEQQGSLRDALQAVAVQTEWPEAAQRAQRLVSVLDGGCDHQHTEDIQMDE